jgi:hypothetical protein
LFYFQVHNPAQLIKNASGQISFMIYEVSSLSSFLGPAGTATVVSLTSGASLFGQWVDP